MSEHRFGSTLKNPFSDLKKSQGATKKLKKELPFNLQDLEQGLNEWKNIPEVVRECFFKIIENVYAQQEDLEEVRSDTQNLQEFEELRMEINKKANLEDVQQTLNHIVETVDEKVSREELGEVLEDFVREDSLSSELAKKVDSSELSTLLESKISLKEYKEEIRGLLRTVDDLGREFRIAEDKFGTKAELDRVRMRIADLSDYEVIKEDLKMKLDKETAFSLIEKKADLEIVEAALEEKVDASDLEPLFSAIEKKADFEHLEQLTDIISKKVDMKEFDSLCSTVNKKANSDIVYELEITIENFKGQMGGFCDEVDRRVESCLRSVDEAQKSISSLNQEITRRALQSEFDRIKKLISKKLDCDTFAKEITSLKKSLSVESAQFKIDYKNFRKGFEEDQYKLARRMDTDKKDIENLVSSVKERMEAAALDRESELQELMKYIKGLNESTKADCSSEYQVVIERVSGQEEQLKRVLSTLDRLQDKEEIDKRLAAVRREMKLKVDLEEVQSSLNACQSDTASKLMSLREEVLSAIRLQNASIMEEVAKKANHIDVKRAIATKVESEDIEAISEAYLKSLDLEGLSLRLGDLEAALEKNGDAGETESRFEILKEDLDSLRKNLLMKANLKDICTLLDKKSNVEDVNKALRTLRDGIEKKSEKVDLSQFVNEQSLINEFLCTENIIGRWKWKSGNVQNGALVPWEQQTINTLADNFIWEKNNPYINIMAPGLYQISFGLFSVKRPTAQILINGQPVYSALNSSAYVMHHSSGKLAQIQDPLGSKNKDGPYTGITLSDFFMIPPKARLCITYACELPGEGFLSVKRLQ